ncbi:MAG: UvrD-helicase domain-containing protein, partial [Deferrisomatales bacterium]|nr:UvrD-helicase domain-containing protein [Deferrisomatales bacterium]
MRPQVFNLVRGPLEGRNLVEASAGTGKTYTIAGLFVRLLLEARLGVDQILVVTFTEAATEELRDRIRRRIRDAVEAFRAGESGGDDLLAGLLSDPAIDREWAAGWLRNALWGFDEAAVHTIHGFCQRVLAEKAFECGAPFEAEVTPDESGLLEEVVADYWRRELHGAPSGFLHYLQDRKVTLQALTRFASDWAGAPNLAVVPEGAVPPSAEGEAAVREAYRRVQELWRASGPEVARLLAEAPGVHRGKYKPRMVPQFAREMDVFAAAGDPLAPCEALPRWSASAVAAAATKGFAPLEHPFFEACQELLELRDALEEEHGARLLALKQGLLGWVRQELPRWKAQRNLRSFDDLLRDVHAALAGPAGPGLAAALSARYRAALIDEFQDTDPVQYEIFRRAFGGAGARLFLIGDPKQAIYSFRGADLFAYLDAAREAEARFTLDRNWRSTPDLLAAVNALFGRREAPFLFEDIGYQAVHSGEPGGKEPLRFDGAPDTAPFQVWFAPRGEAKLLDKASAWADIPRAVAGEVVRLLRAGQEGRATIGGRPVAPEHIACLVRTNRQAQLVQDALREGGVPSVIHGASSLFASREAEEMLRLLAALAEPGREGRVRAALATDLLGVGGEDLRMAVLSIYLKSFIFPY